MPTSPPSAVVLSGVHKTYGKGDGAVVALRDVSLAFAPGSFTAVMGPSGSGKSTFLVGVHASAEERSLPSRALDQHGRAGVGSRGRSSPPTWGLS